MEYHRRVYLLFYTLITVFFVLSCKSKSRLPDTKIVTNPSQMDATASEQIKAMLDYAAENDGRLDDSTRLKLTGAVNAFYDGNSFVNIWSHKAKWEPLADSVFGTIEKAEWYGLFPDDYHFKLLLALRNGFATDSIKRMDASLWSKADLLLTDGLFNMMQDLKKGRLQPDSIDSRPDSLAIDQFFIGNMNDLLKKKALTPLLSSLEPKHRGYQELKKAIPSFLDSMDRKVYTYVSYPYKDSTDSIRFVRVLQKRLGESNCIDLAVKRPDSLQLATAVKKYQKMKGVAADGKVNSGFIRVLNTSDVERFKRIAITMDRYKGLPYPMPDKFIWVNLPGYYLQVWDHDTLALESRTIVGKPATRTPELNSYITDMITYPTWTIPTSIIAKEILPGLKRNAGYLARKGFRLLNSKGEVVDPYSINWSKYAKGIPFKVQQGSGDDNALGIFKFNFANKYSVYLHDTNQRYLFKNGSRALSHGCVRVQEWEKLAFYIARNDSMNIKPGDTLRYNTDSIRNWIAGKDRVRIDVKSRIALYIRYFTCEGKNGKVKFYDDIYGEDKALREKYFAGR